VNYEFSTFHASNEYGRFLQIFRWKSWMITNVKYL